jgi:hypothetical protein
LPLRGWCPRLCCFHSCLCAVGVHGCGVSPFAPHVGLDTLAVAWLVSTVVLFSPSLHTLGWTLSPLLGWCPRLCCFPLRSTRWVGHSRRCVVGVRGCVVPKGHSIIMRVYMGGSGSLSDLCTLKVQSVVQHIPPTHYLRTVHYQHTGGIMRNTRRVQASHGLLLR